MEAVGWSGFTSGVGAGASASVSHPVLVGLRWRETRMLFGKPATAEKWITEADQGRFYKTRAEDNGFVFVTTMSISPCPSGGVTLTSAHDSQPQSIGARIMSIPMGLFFKGAIKKAVLQDLTDIKAAVERRGSGT